MKFVELRIDVFSIPPHSFLHIQDTETGPGFDRGFVPVETALSGPGKIDPYDHEYQARLYRTELTDEQYDAILRAIEESSNNNPYYDLPHGQQCTIWALDMLNKAGIPLPSLPPDNGGFYNTLAYNPYAQMVESLIGHARALIDELSRIPGIIEETHGYFSSAQNWIMRRDPLAFDLDGDGIETVAANSTNPILFDHNGDGIKSGTGWVKSDDGLLVLDRNGNGSIDSGAELFGIDTAMSNGGKGTDGFAALRDLDSNGDGVMDARDTRFAELRVWRDLDQDGVSDAGELQSLSDLGIASINLNATASNRDLGNGNVQTAVSTFTRTDGSTGTAANLNLVADTFHREFTDPITLANGVAALPNMHGSGKVRDLLEAASQSSALREVLAQYAQAGTRAEQQALLDSLLGAWAKTSGMLSMETRAEGHYTIRYQSFGSERLSNHPPQASSGTTASTEGGSSSSGQSAGSSAPIADAAYTTLIEKWQGWLQVLEAFNGRYFFTLPSESQEGESARTGLTVTTPSVGGGSSTAMGTPLGTLNIDFAQAQLDLLEQSYQALRESVYGALVLQTRLKPYLDSISLSVDPSGFHLDCSGIAERLATKRATSPVAAMTDLIELNRYGGQRLYSAGWNGLALLRGAMEQVTGDRAVQAVLTELHVKSVNGSFSGTSAGEFLGLWELPWYTTTSCVFINVRRLHNLSGPTRSAETGCPDF